MKTLANINDNINIKFNKTMTTISENAESQQVAGNRAEEMMASAIAHEAKMAEIKAAEEQEEKMNLRIIKIKPAGNAKMFRTLAKAIAAGATTLIVTTRVDVAGCGYVWFGIRKGYTELDGKLLLNAQIWNYLMAFLMGKELPEVTEFEPDREICCQSEWLAEVAAEVEKLTPITSEEYVRDTPSFSTFFIVALPRNTICSATYSGFKPKISHSRQYLRLSSRIFTCSMKSAQNLFASE